MSLFYQSLSYWENRRFQKRKRSFKRGKPCAICGKLYNDPNEMMVAHIIPVRELSDYDALHDQSNWEVRCIYCERRLNREEDLRKNRLEQKAKQERGVLPVYELDVYADYDANIRSLWAKAIKNFNMTKIHRRSSYYKKIEEAVLKADNLTLAKAAARYVMSNNGRMPMKEEIYAQLKKDVENVMLFEIDGKFKKEKGEKNAA